MGPLQFIGLYSLEKDGMANMERIPESAVSLTVAEELMGSCWDTSNKTPV